MFRSLSPRSISLVAILFTAAGMSFGSTPSRIVPLKGETIRFSKTYDSIYLKETNPYHKVAKTNLSLKNQNGLLTATWKATLRDMATDARFEGMATGICKAHGSKKIECNFPASSGSVNLAATAHGLDVTILPCQAVLFQAPEKDGMIQSDLLFGADEDNNQFSLARTSI
jgi:hypothetical protein